MHNHILVWSNIERVIFCTDANCSYSLGEEQILGIVKGTHPMNISNDVCPECAGTGRINITTPGLGANRGKTK